MMRGPLSHKRGFTLIELSIVLVIIGLIIGGVLVGQDLIRAAEVRATISQIERYNTAVNTFQAKFNALPGDISASQVTQLGFTVTPARVGTEGQGDGNGLIEGYFFAGTVDDLTNGETAWFWEDLSSNSGLIEGSFNTATTTPGTPLAYVYTSGLHTIGSIVPEAKLGHGTYIYVYAREGVNFYGLSEVTSIDQNGAVYGNAGLSVAEAYGIDKKLDDGFPQSGRVTAQYENWPGNIPGFQWSGGPYGGVPYTSATAGSASTCFDNGNVAGATQQYSVEQNGGSGVNCGLSFQFQ